MTNLVLVQSQELSELGEKNPLTPVSLHQRT